MSIDELDTIGIAVDAVLCSSLDNQREREQQERVMREEFSQLPTPTLQDMLVDSLRRCSADAELCEEKGTGCLSCSHQFQQDILCSILIKRAEQGNGYKALD